MREYRNNHAKDVYFINKNTIIFNKIRIISIMDSDNVEKTDI